MEGLSTLAALVTGAVISILLALALEWLWLWTVLRIVGSRTRRP
jgi:hypothetical protein